MLREETVKVDDFKQSNHIENDDRQDYQSIDDFALVMDDNNNQSTLTTTSEKSNEIRQRVLSRWEDGWNKKLQLQQQVPISKKPTVKLSAGKIVVKEFLPQTADDSILSIVRQIFVNSFNEYYKEIEEKLKLKENKTLVQWLDETFDDEQDEMLQRQIRCFMLCSSDDALENSTNQGIIGFLTLKEEKNGSIYIAQCAIDAQSKRRGYGGRLIRHLRTIYPAGTHYWGLCRRVNEPAVKFYLKQGAKIMDDRDVATKYGYDPQLYAGFHFTDNTETIPTKISVSNVSASAPEPTSEPRFHATRQDNSTMTELSFNTKNKRRSHNRLPHCVIL